MTKLHPRLQKVTFLGFAPNVTNGYFVMRADGKIELTSNLHEETRFDESSELPEPKKDSEVVTDDHITQTEMDAIMGPEGGSRLAFYTRRR